ncbi:MAG: hypothetical protein OXC53_09965 [Rhodobacteraceae bacterium]|nr:hypothetical protein [Paracoccaceae bacterium]
MTIVSESRYEFKPEKPQPQLRLSKTNSRLDSPLSITGTDSRSGVSADWSFRQLSHARRNDSQLLFSSWFDQVHSSLKTTSALLEDSKTLEDTLAHLDHISDMLKEYGMDTPPDPSAVNNAHELIGKIHAIYPVKYYISPTERRGVVIDAPMKKGAAVSIECAPNDIVYCFVAINGKRRRAKFYQTAGLPDLFIETALQDLAKA